MSKIADLIATYGPQVLVFAIAVIGVLYKSLTTEGETKYLIFRGPTLSRIGKAVLICLILSFLLGVAVTYGARKSEESANAQRQNMARQLDEVREYNKGIIDGVEIMRKQAAASAQYQQQAFETVLSEQKNTGAEIASDIQTAADKMKASVDSASARLRGRVDDSIVLLNHSAQSIAALSDPIRDIIITAEVEIPLTDPVLKSYRTRLESGIMEYSSSPQNHRDYQIFPRGDEAALGPNSSLLPDSETEPEASMILGSLGLTLSLCKSPLDDLQAKRTYNDLSNVDLYFGTGATVSRRQETAPPRPWPRVIYKTKTHSMLIEFPGQLLRQESDDLMVTRWMKTGGARINGIPDLANSQLIVQIAHRTRPGETDDVSLGVKKIQQHIKVSRLEIIFSSQVRLMYFEDEEMYGERPHYYGRLDAHFRILRDNDGYPIYLYQFPSSLQTVNRTINK